MEGQIDRKEGLAYADSPTNLMWRLQNDFARQTAPEQQAESPSNEASFTEITLDVHHTASDKAPKLNPPQSPCNVCRHAPPSCASPKN